MKQHRGHGPDLGAVREALRSALETRGHRVAGDTVGFRRELYIQGDGDSARALFETKISAVEAAETMYQGHWGPELPPRVAVIPGTDEEDWMVDLLRQAGILTLGFHTEGGSVTFPRLDDLLTALDA